MHDVREWLGRRSYDYTQFADPVPLARRKRDLGLSVTVLLPCLQATPAIEPLINEIHALNELAPLVDQIAVVAVNSYQDMGAVCPDVEVYYANELMPEYGPVIGKGDAMWRALSIAHGDLVVYANVETPAAFKSSFVLGVLGPVLSVPRVSFAKAAYQRPLECPQDVFETEIDGALTELMARPLLDLYYPELSGFLQPLSGEFAAPRELLRSIPYFTGHTAELTILIDLLEEVGIDAMAQVDFGIRSERGRRLHSPGYEAYAMLRAVELRSGRDSFGLPPSEGADPRVRDTDVVVDSYVRPVASSEGVRIRKDTAEIAERPPLTRVLQESTRSIRTKYRGGNDLRRR